MTKGAVDVVWRGLDAAAVTRLSQQVQQSPEKQTASGFHETVLTGTRVLQLQWSPTSPMRAESRPASGDRRRPAGRPHLRFDRARWSARPPRDLPARRQGETEGHLEEPDQPHPRLRPVDAQRPRHRHPDPDPAGEHRRAERPAAARRAEHRPDPGGPQGVDGDRSGLAAALSRRPAARRRRDGSTRSRPCSARPPTTSAANQLLGALQKQAAVDLIVLPDQPVRRARLHPGRRGDVRDVLRPGLAARAVRHQQWLTPASSPASGRASSSPASGSP